MKVLELIPISIFLFYIRYIEINSRIEWKLPFFMCGFAGLGIIILFLIKKIPFNKVYLGINFYFISGAGAFLTHQWWLNKIYGDLRASGMLFWVFIICFLGLFTGKGLIETESDDGQRVKSFSFLLFAVILLSLVFSLFFKEYRLLSEIIPFFVILISQ